MLSVKTTAIDHSYWNRTRFKLLELRERLFLEKIYEFESEYLRILGYTILVHYKL